MKRYVVEAIGTFFLTLAISLTGNPIAIGLMLMAMIYVGGHVSGGHFNPAVSLVMALEKRISHEDMIKYWIAQIGGATLALCMFMMITNNMFVPEMVPGSSVLLAALIEALFTMVFCWVIVNMVVSSRYKDAALSGIVIGLTLMAVAFIGGLFNPAVAMGSLVCNMIKNGIMADIPTVVVYVVSPLVGGILASLLYNKVNA